MVGGVLIILVFLFLWIIFAPLHLVLNTACQQYEIFQFGTFSFAFHPRHQAKLAIRIFGISLPVKSKPKAVAEKPARVKPAFKRSVDAWRFLIVRSLRSIDVRHMELDIDTGDVVTNAKLVPVVFFLSGGPLRLQTNFEGRVFCHIELVAHINRLIWIFFRFLIKK